MSGYCQDSFIQFAMSAGFDFSVDRFYCDVFSELEWTYVFIPTMSIYRMPYPEMVSLLRKALENIYTRAKVVEAKWVSDANKPEFNAEKQKERQDSMERASQAQAVYRDMVEEVGYRITSPSKRLNTIPQSSARRPQSPIRIQISKTPFGLRPPPEELLPEADPVPASSANSPIRVSLSRIFKDIPCDPSSEVYSMSISYSNFVSEYFIQMTE